jgi:hypothetical protein
MEDRLMKRIGIGPILMLIFVLVPLMLLAFPQPPTGNTGAPGDGNCTSCHNGISTGGSVVITFPSGLNYTPGVTQHLSVTVSDTTHSVWSFQVTARLASNTSAQAGSFTATDTINTIVQSSGTIQDIETTSSGINQSTWNFDWTPPASNVGNVNFYVTGLAAGGSAGATSGNGIYNASYTLTAPVATKPALALSPTSLSFSVPQGGAAPTAQTVSVTSGGTPVSYNVATSGGTWLSTSTTSGTTPGAFSASVNPTGLAAGTYNGTVTITSSGASNSPQTVAVTLTVTPAATNTLSATPSMLTFAYQSGGSAPAAQTVNVSSSGSALNFTAASTGGSWLSVTPTTGTTPGTVSVSVNPTGLAAGTFAGTVTIASAGAAGSPQTVAVTLVVSSGGSGSAVTVAPSTLRFAASGLRDDDGGVSAGIAPQKLTISAASSNVTYTVAEATSTGGHWLIVGPTQGTTPGTETVSVNAAGLAAGTYKGTVTITPSGTSAQAVIVPVTLVVGTPQTVSTLRAYPSRLLFSDPAGGASSSKNVRITSTGAPLTFSATSHGGSWLTVSPTTGTTPSTLSVTVDPHGLAAGAYSGVISLTSGSQRAAVAVRMYVATSGGEGGPGTEAEVRLSAVPMVNDPAGSEAVGAEWLNAAGVPTGKSAENGVTNSGLALTKTAKAPLGTSAGAMIVPAESLTTLTELGFDIRQGTHCTASSPHFVVVTSDDVTHVLTGCANGTTQAAPAPGWVRMQFDPSNAIQAKPAIAPGQAIKSIAIVLDEGPEASPHVGGGLAVIDNITVNGTVVKEQ